MISVFPTERGAKRQVLLDAVDEVRDVLAAGADEAEHIATLPKATVEALYESGLLSLKLPLQLGGAEADLVTQLDVFEAVTRIDTSAGWCLLIGSASLGRLGAFLPDEAIDRLFVDGRPPKTCGVAMRTGEAYPVEGGYRVSGRWSFASGIQHSEWVTAGVRVVVDGDRAPETLAVVFPTSVATIHDNWQVGGLRGTGSNDFSVTDLYVPAAFTLDRHSLHPKRGGAIYRLGMPGFVAVEHAGFAFGVARRALDAIIELAQAKHRGYTSTSSLALRSSFQRALGEDELRLRAARALVVEILEAVWDWVSHGEPPTLQMQVEMRSSATYATEIAVDVVTRAFRAGGGSALYESSILPRCLRDINAAAQHLMVSDVTYEHYGKMALGLPDIDPMG
jgi:alkylation response protein AidB-like acyl-CoA dehydrogenase